MTESTNIILTPAGMLVPGGPERVAKAMAEFTDRTAEVANLATQFLESYDAELPHLADVIDVEREQGYDADLLELHDACTARQRAQEELLRAIAGVSPFQPAPSFEDRVAETQRIMRDMATAPVTPIRATQEVPRG